MDGGRDDGRADLGLVVGLAEELGEPVRHGVVELREGLLLLADGVVPAAAVERGGGVEAVVGRRHAGHVVHVGAVLADHPDGDVALGVAEDGGDNEVEAAEDQRKDARGQGEAPEGQAQLGDDIVAVEGPQNPDAHGHHPHSQPRKAVSAVADVKGGEGGPVVAVKVPDEGWLRELADDEQQGDTTGDAVGNGLEDEEVGGHISLDDQDHTRNRHAEQGDDVAGPENIEDVPSWSQQGAVLCYAKHKHFDWGYLDNN